MTGPAMGLPGQLANESIADYKQRFQAQLAFIEAEEQRQLAAEAARLQAEAAATAEKLRLQAEADADAQARRKEAQDLLQRHEANSIERLKFWHFEPNGDDATPEEQHKEFLFKLVTRLLYACNYQRSELERQNQELQQQYQDLKTQHQELANLYRIVQSHEDATRALNSRVLDLEQAVPGPDARASSSAPSSRQLEERVDHVVIAAVPDLDLPFTHLRREFYNRSCAALSQALGDREQYATFAEIIDKAREIIKTNRAAAHKKSTWQPTYVEKQHQAQDLPLPGSGQGGCATPSQLEKLSFAGGEATPPSTPPDSAALLAASCTSGEDANVVSSRYTYEDYAVHLVPTLDQPLHVQQSTACTVSSPSANDLAASPPSITGDSTSWSRLEELDPLTFADFQWMPVPPSGRLLKPHRNLLMARLRDYLHTVIPTPLMDAGVEVVDLHAYIAKIDREFKTQRYDDIDAPLLYVRIQIGEATCSALIDCGASRNYISQDFMVRAGLGPHVRRKPHPTQVTLADGHTHKSIDRCIDDVPVYFAPHASEAVSFDILDTKFDMILGMSWLRSEHHPVNFYNRTVHIRDRNEILVPCMVPLPHPSISCHVVSAASMRASIIRDDIQEMGVCFLHALPPHDASSTDSSSDPRITELLDAYSDVFEGPHGVVPDRPIRHEIILEDGAVLPRGCIYRMSEEELSVLRAQLDDLLEKGWIRPSSSPYGAPVLFVRKKNKDLRLCIDYRKLNAQKIRNAGPLPRINDLLERLGGTKFFSKLYLKSGYHQLEIRQEDRYKTAFKTRYGHFEWLVMPFGLTNAPATFQAAMTMEFRHMLDRYVLIYLDEILVYSRSLDEHVEHLPTVLERLRQAKYKANRNKCEFAGQELEYLGHYVTPQGIRPLADKIEALRVWAEPTITTEVRSFMGLAGYYQRFVTGYLRIAAPMTRLQSPKVPFVFDDEARRYLEDEAGAMALQLELMSTEQDTGALPRRSARLAVRSRSVVPPRTKYQQQRLSKRTTPAASSTALTVPVTTGVLPACSVQGTLEPLADYLGRLQVFTDVVATAKAQQEAAEAERQRLANEAAAQAQQTAEADVAARDRRNAASTESLIQTSCRTVPTDDMMKALYLQLIGGSQAWMNHLAATKKCTIAELHTHITWKEFEQLWFTRFMVRNVVKAAMNEVYTCSQGSMPTRDWTTKWQKIVTMPGFDSSFLNQRSEFFSRWCAGLRTALSNEYDYASFQAILDRANLVIQTDDKAANERQSQPHYVAKQGYQRPTHNNAVISEETVDLHAAAASSSDGGRVAALSPKRPKRVRKNKATQETTSTGTGQ
ncbi:hypothetical protein CBR_g38346 [Chara braunii]|uniref:Reverse transcriptase domain-containing protein n=1 Tax=Chara braunii TaxID=69332 RepID=A0A388LPY4_CHABU|nr:hypothetical protein CBR_g38346 [Chara braunii]|eukprot:GBG84374.1 hypothetical protein CBR_g38346 [Chara braunii]